MTCWTSSLFCWTEENYGGGLGELVSYGLLPNMGDTNQYTRESVVSREVWWYQSGVGGTRKNADSRVVAFSAQMPTDFTVNGYLMCKQ